MTNVQGDDFCLPVPTSWSTSVHTAGSPSAPRSGTGGVGSRHSRLEWDIRGERGTEREPSAHSTYSQVNLVLESDAVPSVPTLHSLVWFWFMTITFYGVRQSN